MSVAYGVERTFFLPLRYAGTGQPIGAVPTVAVSKDGGAFAAATNAPVAVTDRGCTLTLTAAEMTAQVVTLDVTGATILPQTFIIATDPQAVTLAADQPLYAPAKPADIPTDYAKTGEAATAVGTLHDFDPETQTVDVGKISGDATAADNLEQYCDGTAKLPVDVLAIGNSTTAANNLELAYNGTGYAGGTTKQQVDIRAIYGDQLASVALFDFVANGYDAATNKINGVKLVDTTTTNTDMRGTDNAATAVALAAHDGKLDTVDANVDAVLEDTGTTIPATLSTVDGKVDIVDGILDTTLPLIQRVYRYFFNKRTHTNSAVTIYADDGVSVDASMTVTGDATTVTKDAPA